MSHSTLETDFLYSTMGEGDLAELVEIFVGEMRNRIASLESAAEGADWDDLTRVAHQLKGAAGSYGFDQITPFAAKLESICRQQKPAAEILAAKEALVEVCGRIRAGAPQS